MNNLDMPAMALEDVVWVDSCNPELGTFRPMGFTKREQACLTMGVADSDCAELDAIIEKGSKQRLAGLAMQGMLSSLSVEFPRQLTLAIIAKESIITAESLLQQLKGDV